MIRWGAAVILAALTTLGTAACSSGPSLASFIAKADPICAAANRDAASLSGPTEFAGYVAFGTETAEKTAAELTRLQALTPPGGHNKAKVRSLLADLRHGRADAQATSDTAAAGNYMGLERVVSRTAADFHRADHRARQLGSKDCGRFQADLAVQAEGAAPAAAKEGFIAKADHICNTTNDQLAALTLPDNPTRAQLLDVYSKLVDLEDKALARLRELPRPNLDRPALEAWLSELELDLEAVHHVRDAAAAGDTSAARQYVTAPSTAGAKADAYGAHECGAAPTEPS